MKCPSCGFENDAGVAFCGNCGARMPEKKVKDTGGKTPCPHCGGDNPPGARFCQNCGRDMAAPAPVPEQVPQPAPLSSPRKRSVPGWLWAALGGLVLILIVGSLLFFNRSEPIPLERPAEEISQPAPCEDKLLFVKDVTVPDGTVLRPGEVFTKTWRVKNSGACSWTKGYQFTFKKGQQMGASRALNLPGGVNPGEEIDLSIDFTAPSDAGSYQGFWNLQDEDGNVVPVEGVADNSVFVDVVVGDASLPVMEPFKEGDAAEKIGDLVENKDSPNNKWTVNIPADKPVKFSWGWCTATEEILEQNLQHMQILFYVDGVDVTASMARENDSSQGYPCRNYSGVVKSWPPGQHTVLYRMIFEEKVNDGEKDYEGENTKTYTINVEP